MVLIVHDIYDYLLWIVDWSVIMSSQVVDNTWFLFGKFCFSVVDYIFIDDFSLLIRKGSYSETNIRMEEKAAVCFS